MASITNPTSFQKKAGPRTEPPLSKTKTLTINHFRMCF